MKTIGLIGGVSWFSTAEYYVRLNKLIHQKLGSQFSAKILLYSFNFEDILKYQISNDAAKEASLLIEAARKLESAGVDFVLIASNTTNKTAKLISESISIPLIDIIELTAKHLSVQGLKNVGLLGTQSVMLGDFYKSTLFSHGIAAKTPDINDCKILNRIIYDELCHGILNPQSRKIFLENISALASQGVEAVVLGCTEIPILIQQADTKIRLIDSTQLHVEKAIELVLEK